MVNYCCVQHCGRNSKLSSHLTFYCLPKELHRQWEWLLAGGRDDLLDKLNSKSTYRFCSRHFAPSCIRNRTLSPDAIPTLCLPGSKIEDESPDKPVQHHDIVCNSCNNEILGFRYKCVTCVDYDLCPRCEMMETHPHHYMLRIPRPLKFKIADDMIQKWRDFFKSQHVKPDCTQSSDESGDSSDDEPITKYVKQYDSGVDLSEDVKATLRKEVERILTLSEETNSKQTNNNSKQPSKDLRTRSAAVKRSGIESGSSAKKQTLPVIQTVGTLTQPAPELAFADVNQLPDRPDVKYLAPAASGIDGELGGEFTQPLMHVKLNDDLTELMTLNEETKSENSSKDLRNRIATVKRSGIETGPTQPLMHVKLSDDLTELMIEMTQNGETTVYKYTD